MADNARWFVVHTYSGYENKVASNITTVVENRKMQDQIFEVRIPTETVTEIKDFQVIDYGTSVKVTDLPHTYIVVGNTAVNGIKLQ